MIKELSVNIRTVIINRDPNYMKRSKLYENVKGVICKYRPPPTGVAATSPLAAMEARRLLPTTPKDPASVPEPPQLHAPQAVQCIPFTSQKLTRRQTKTGRSGADAVAVAAAAPWQPWSSQRRCAGEQ